MSTNCILAIPNGDAWRGRYSHWDGNPKSKVPGLRALIERDGVEQVIKVLTEEHHAWSTVRASYGSTEEEDRGEGYTDVPGYGCAYADDERNADEWRTSDTVSAPWAYVIYPKVLTVLWGGEEQWHLVATLRYDLPVTDEDLVTIECGARYERCPHYAWVHFPEAEGTHYNTREWVAEHGEVCLDNACAVLIGDTRFAFGGFGQITFADGRAAWNDPDWSNTRRPIFWSTSIKTEDGSPAGEVLIGRRTKAGLKLRYPIVLPANGARGEVVIPAGEVVHG